MLIHSWIVCSLFGSVRAFSCDSHNIQFCENVPVNIQIHGGIPVHDADYILHGNSDGNSLQLASTGTSVREKFMLERVGDQYYIKVLGGTADGKIYLSTSGQGHLDVKLWNQDQGNGNQRWDLWSRADGRGPYWRIHQNINNALLEDEAQDHNLEMQGNHRRRRVPGHNLLEAHGDGKIALGPDRGNGFQNWDIQHAGCYVVDPDKVTASWHYRFTVACSGCNESVTKGMATYQDYQADVHFKASLHATVKAGFHLAGFGTGVRVHESLGLELAGRYEGEFLTWENFKFDWPFQPGDKGKNFWQFKFEATDSCGQTITTWTNDFALTKGDIASKEPCCVPGHAKYVPSYTTCYEPEFMIPGGNKSGHCHLTSEEEFAV